MKHEARGQGNQPDLRKVGLNPNHWYPLALMKDLKRGASLAASFAGEPIVIVRTRDDKFYALEDRCAHRQMPLSYGSIVGDRLQCCYHGWTYDENGNCTLPFSSAGAALPRGVRAYPVRVAYGLVFVFPGDPIVAEAISVPNLPEYTQNFASICVKRKIDCHYSFMHENLMDMSHQFLHRRWMGQFRPLLLDARKEKNEYVEVDYAYDPMQGSVMLRTLLPRLLGKAASGKIAQPDDLPSHTEAKSGDHMTISTRYPYQWLTLHRRGESQPMLKLWLAYVPLDKEQRSNQPCGLLMIKRPRIPGLIFVLRPFFELCTNAIFREDRFALEAEQKAYDAQGGDWNQEVLPFVLDLRNLLIARGVPIPQ